MPMLGYSLYIFRPAENTNCSIQLNQVLNPQKHWRPLALELWWQQRQRRHNPSMTGDSLTHHPNFVPRVPLLPDPRVTGTLGTSLGIQTLRGTYRVICVLLLCVGGVKMINDCLEVLNHLLQLSVNVLRQLVTERSKKAIEKWRKREYN